MEAVYQIIKNIAVYLILVTVLLNLVNGKSYKKYVELVCGMILILIVLMPVTRLLSLEDDFHYNYDLSSFKLELMDAEFLNEAEEMQQKKMEEEYKKVLEEKITTIVEQEGRHVQETEIVLSKEDYGIVEDITVEISAAKEKQNIEGNQAAEDMKTEDVLLVEQVQIEEIVILREEEMSRQEEVTEKNKVTEAIRKQLASEFAMKEERIIVYQKEE